MAAKGRALSIVLAIAAIFASGSAFASIPRSTILDTPPIDLRYVDLTDPTASDIDTSIDNVELLHHALDAALFEPLPLESLSETRVWVSRLERPLFIEPRQLLSDGLQKASAATWPEIASGPTVLTPDPLGYVDSSNLYAFAGGDPVNGRDPEGLADNTKPNLAVRVLTAPIVVRAVRAAPKALDCLAGVGQGAFGSLFFNHVGAAKPQPYDTKLRRRCQQAGALAVAAHGSFNVTSGTATMGTGGALTATAVGAPVGVPATVAGGTQALVGAYEIGGAGTYLSAASRTPTAAEPEAESQPRPEDEAPYENSRPYTRKGTKRHAWDNAADGTTPNSKACVTCGDDVFGNPHTGELRNTPRGWDLEHVRKWELIRRELRARGALRKEYRDAYNDLNNTVLRCPHCNRADNQLAP